MHVIVPARFGGAEAVVRNLALGARGLEFDAEVAAVVYSEGEHPFVERLRADGTLVHPVVAGARRYGQEVKGLAAVLKRCRADLVHTHVYHANFVGFWAARPLNLPVVATIHGFTGGDWKNRLYEWADLRFLRWFDGVACVSEPIRQRVISAGSRHERVFLVPNGIVPARLLTRADARAALNVDHDRLLVGWIGRLSPEKGPDLLVEAIGRMSHPRPGAVLIGSGAELTSLKRRVAARGLAEESVRMVGERDNAASLLAAFDVLVLSSRAEGTPIVLLEAMAARVPIVAFAVGGIPGVLDAASGWVVTPGDVDALGAAIREALSDPSAAAERAAVAHERFAERHTARRAASALATLYEAVLSRPRRGAHRGV